MDAENQPMKFCKYCGGKIPEDAVLCTLCGRQVEELRRDAPAPQVIINNANTNLWWGKHFITGQVRNAGKHIWVVCGNVQIIHHTTSASCNLLVDIL